VQILEEFLTEENFDFVVIDPPWKNRYIKRVKKLTNNSSGYQTMTDEEISKIPLGKYLHKNSIVAIWCTNSESHIESLRNKILLNWHLKLISTWHWIKIDCNGELFNQFDGNKKPYERLFIATHMDNENYNKNIDKNLQIFTNPSSIHSHKPPLIGKI
jgi:N(6)-adenine-specific DNA methyltransferase